MPHLRAWRPLILCEASEIQSMGGGGGGVPIVSAALSKRLQKKKNASAQGSLKFREVSNCFWEATRRKKTRLKKVSYLLTYSQNKICTFTCGCIVLSSSF